MCRRGVKGRSTSGVGRSGTRKISSMPLKEAQVKAYELFISGTFRVVFQAAVDHASLKPKSDTVGEGRWLCAELVEGRDHISLMLCDSPRECSLAEGS